MRICIHSFAIGLGLVVGCVPLAKDVVDDTEGGSAGETGGQPTTAGGTGGQPTTAGESGGQPTTGGESGGSPGTGGESGGSPTTGGETGGSPTTGGETGGPDGVVDCSTLPLSGPTVAGGEISVIGFPEGHCDPGAASPAGPGGYTCCSVDPAAEGGALPDYQDHGIVGGATPYFSDVNNSAGGWGMCVKTDGIPEGSGLLAAAAFNCPIPCNPTWGQADTDAVCGGRSCCQTHELQPEDCVQDPDSGLWRAAVASDIGELTDWSAEAHATHQDPGAATCLALAGGSTDSPVWADCVDQLSVADQRGLCLSLPPGQGCPDQDPGYLDACEQLNL